VKEANLQEINIKYFQKFYGTYSGKQKTTETIKRLAVTGRLEEGGWVNRKSTGIFKSVKPVWVMQKWWTYFMKIQNIQYPE
jgi:hypothetical protein